MDIPMKTLLLKYPAKTRTSKGVLQL